MKSIRNSVIWDFEKSPLVKHFKKGSLWCENERNEFTDNDTEMGVVV